MVALVNTTHQSPQLSPTPKSVALYPVAPGAAITLAERLLNDCATSNWLRSGLASALRRDPVDAANDAELLLSVLLARVEDVQGGAA